MVFEFVLTELDMCYRKSIDWVNRPVRKGRMLSNSGVPYVINSVGTADR